VTKRLGLPALGYIFQTFLFRQNIFGTPTSFSVMCNNQWKTGPIFDPLQTPCELWYKAILNYCDSMKDCIARARNLPTSWPTKHNHVYVIPNGCHKETGVFNKWRRFGNPLFDCPHPQTPGLDPPLCLRWNSWNWSSSAFLNEKIL